ncbi:MAG: carboxypeptidase-like regulatory domain-containing protein, partial [Bacteroidales bacterium]|nr:carboxypeptidase-like regulatory domain-containing protein [Bacteroidales bacterium]
MTKRISLQLYLFIAINVACHAQAVQTIKGVIVDKQSEIPLPGVNVVIEGTSPLMGTITDEAGFYSIDEVPFGKYTVKASYIGYETSLHQNTLVGAGKQVVLNFSLTENSTLLNEVTVRP